MTNKNDIEQLFKAHYAQMYRLAVALLHDDDLARDIVHDVFASLLDSSLDITVSGGYARDRCGEIGPDALRDLGRGCRRGNCLSTHSTLSAFSAG